MANPKMEDVFALYQSKVALLSSAQKEKLCTAYDEGMTPFVIGCAILKATQEQRRSRLQGKNKRISFNYIQAIIQDWLNHGITSDERFYAYWSAINEDETGVGGERFGSDRDNAQKEVRSEKLTPTRPSQDRSRFSFLDN